MNEEKRHREIVPANAFNQKLIKVAIVSQKLIIISFLFFNQKTLCTVFLVEFRCLKKNKNVNRFLQHEHYSLCTTKTALAIMGRDLLSCVLINHYCLRFHEMFKCFINISFVFCSILISLSERPI